MTLRRFSVSERELDVFLAELPPVCLWLMLWMAGLAMAFVATMTTLALIAVVATPAYASKVPLGENVLAPMANTVFCLKYKDDCKSSVENTVSFSKVESTLNAVNVEVNREILFDPSTTSTTSAIVEKWHVWPQAGQCHDYAVTKRHELLKLGLPAGALRLAEVAIPTGEHHLVLVVETKEEDLVLDNLRPVITPWENLPYHWIRIQSSANPNFWLAIK
ncbi:MAG: transglutaminase-like cysteine peptidase [Candidatus Pacebacteria bacterium]|nr:transglutaminase-like cysteine peptidase [Candidatus Paceibacterota bacterium]